MSTSNAQFAVVKVSKLRELSPKTTEQVLAAQDRVDDDMISALEDMIRAAKENRISGESALELRAIAW